MDGQREGIGGGGRWKEREGQGRKRVKREMGRRGGRGKAPNQPGREMWGSEAGFRVIEAHRHVIADTSAQSFVLAVVHPLLIIFLLAKPFDLAMNNPLLAIQVR